MNNINFEKFVSMQHVNDLLNKNFIEKSVMDSIVDFHQEQLWFPYDIVREKNMNHLMFSYWEQNLCGTDVSNEFETNRILLSDVINKGDTILNSTILALNESLKRLVLETKSILPLILVGNQDQEYPLKSGCYLFVRDSSELIPLREWTEIDIRFLEEYNVIFGDGQDISIALALDLRRAIVVDGGRGYRKSILEIGKVSTSIEYELKQSSVEGIDVKQILDFADNAVTKACGLNLKLAPVISIQHVKKEVIECTID
ncbi:hypothetical protein ADM98_00770 [Exiguobacterium sp. BMC-KP]|uniref:hypothetical protein n=1 Tax=Exiguobacterium sp. BMC-KP TaxID=1684312 RepID=UPI0006AA3907|nr:hypothetical protein [Exiguobacterium sp. BMC-KP]KOP31413.1 hypothetical protein ADM98_00770 [Exiguobacterium sp. BMC-KP]